jgi:hypothetical protein
MIRLLLIVLFIASIVMSNQAMAVVDDTPVFVTGGTLAISSIPATSGTASVSVTNFPSTQNVSVIGVVTTNGTQTISGPVNTYGTTSITGGTIGISGAVVTTGTVQIGAGAASIGSISNSSFGVTGVVTTTGTNAISGIVTTVGTNAVSNFPAVQIVSGTMALSANAATATNQASEISQLGTIGNAVVNGTLNTSAQGEVTFAGSLSVSAVATGTLSIDTSKGYDTLTIYSTSSGSFNTDDSVSWFGSLDGVNYIEFGCFDMTLLDGQFLFSNGTEVSAGGGQSQSCPITGFKSIRIVLGVGPSGNTLTTYASIAKRPTGISGIASTIFIQDIDWRVSAGPNANSPTAANSKPIIQATDADPFRVQGTIACSNCTGSSSSGTTAVSTVQSGTLNVVTTVGSITNPVTVNAHNISGGTLGVIQLATVTGTVNIAGTPTVNLTGGTIGVSGVVTTTGTLVQGAAGASAWLTTSLVGTTSAGQLGTWTVQPGNTANTTAWLTTSLVGTTSASQLGTWTVQPGNTANTTAWLTTSLVGTTSASQLGTWTVQPGNTANTTPWLTTSTIGTLTALGSITNALPAGTNLLGKTGIDQVTAGANGVVVNTGTLAIYPQYLSAVSVSFNESAAAPTAATWYKKRQWQVPSGSTFLPDKAKSMVTTAGSRTLIGTGVVMGSLNLSSNAFTDSVAVSAPRFFSRMLGCVTTVMSAVSDNITVSYTDDLGNAHTSVATTFPASTPVGDCIEIPLAATTGQMTDTGFRDVTNITDSAAPTGVIEIIGMNPLHDTLGGANVFELSTLDNSVVLQNEFIWLMEMQAATTAQQRAAAIEGAIRTP